MLCVFRGHLPHNVSVSNISVLIVVLVSLEKFSSHSVDVIHGRKLNIWLYAYVKAVGLHKNPSVVSGVISSELACEHTHMMMIWIYLFL